MNTSKKESFQHRRDVLFDADEIAKEIRASSKSTAIYIGCDSKVYSDRSGRYIAFATVVIIHKDGSHGAKIYKQITTERFMEMKQRLMKEVELAIDIGYKLLDDIGDRPFQIHLDVNPDPKYASSSCVKEATGYVLGMFGFKPKLKPEAWASSSVSDRWAVKEAKKRKVRVKKLVE